MRRGLVLVEGQTEQAFVNRTLNPHLQTVGLYLTPIVVETKRPASGGKHAGGVSAWAKLEPQLDRLLDDRGAVVTTMFDLYGLPRDAPGARGSEHLAPRPRVETIEQALADHMRSRRQHEHFVPYVSLHEFEALMYTSPDDVAAHAGSANLGQRLRADLEKCGERELIDDGPDTAPSKRVARHWPGFAKAIDGPSIVHQIGIARLVGSCPHFGAWVRRLEAIA